MKTESRDSFSGSYDQEGLQKAIKTKWAGKPVYFFEKLDSTNIQAKHQAEKGAAHGTLIAADMQTAGKGRWGRGWDSPAGANVYFTLLLRPGFSPDKASMLTLVMAYAVVRGIEKTIGETMPGKPSGIKWPNDPIIRGKKICGILTELCMDGNAMKYVIIGCGINVGKQEFAPELARKATSLEKELGRRIHREKLLADIMEAFEEEYESFEGAGSLAFMRDKYHQLLVNLDREVCVLDPAGEYRGIARGINETGELLVELPDGGTRAIYAGEVSVRGVYGYV